MQPVRLQNNSTRLCLRRSLFRLRSLQTTQLDCLRSLSACKQPNPDSPAPVARSCLPPPAQGFRLRSLRSLLPQNRLFYSTDMCQTEISSVIASVPFVKRSLSLQLRRRLYLLSSWVLSGDMKSRDLLF
ncbi:hypothetical protein NPIL_311301 [Nephila pilipes]|uniref:Uncharacterized protein n=1 Tax=Nephila pilipes TaxID=299642 RepID=A0A8X6NT62_NEPPI|nr:hypothetical protein NPIL_311301 [Nephila pilipes]